VWEGRRDSGTGFTVVPSATTLAVDGVIHKLKIDNKTGCVIVTAIRKDGLVEVVMWYPKFDFNKSSSRQQGATTASPSKQQHQQQRKQKRKSSILSRLASPRGKSKQEKQKRKATVQRMKSRRIIRSEDVNPMLSEDDEFLQMFSGDPPTGRREDGYRSEGSASESDFDSVDDWLDRQREKDRVIVKAVFRFDAEADDELNFEPGEEFVALQKEDDKWWWGEKFDSSVGLFPNNFVLILSGDPKKLKLRGKENDNPTPTQSQARKKAGRMRRPIENRGNNSGKKKWKATTMLTNLFIAPAGGGGGGGQGKPKKKKWYKKKQQKTASNQPAPISLMSYSFHKMDHQANSQDNPNVI